MGLCYMSRTESDDPGAWFAKADDDLRIGQLLLSESGLADAVCYHAQQCAEKYLKGYLKSRRVRFRWAHDLRYLIDLCERAAGPDGGSDEFAVERGDAQWLTRSADSSRYPGDAKNVCTPDDARRALGIAERVRTLVLRKVGV